MENYFKNLGNMTYDELDALFKHVRLNAKEELLLFSFPNYMNVLKAYLSHSRPAVGTEIKILGLPLEKAQELLRQYIINQHCYLHQSIELQLLENNALFPLLKWYICHSNFGAEENEVAMMENPRVEEILRIYLAHHELSSKAEAMLFKLPHPDELIQFYIANMVYNVEAHLSEESEAKLFELESAKETVLLYIDTFSLHKENELNLLNYDFGLEVLKTYIQKHRPSNDLIMSLSQRKQYELINIFRHKYLP